MPDLLLEVGTEELPARYIPAALDDLKREAAKTLKALGLEPRTLIATGTPRRLVLAAAELPLGQAARVEEVLGPPESAAFKDGKPTNAATGFARREGVPVESLTVKETPKGRYVSAQKRIEGRRTADLLVEALPPLVLGLSFPKTMRWKSGDGDGAPAPTFPRPIRRVLALLGRDPLPLEIAGVRAAPCTVGHPFVAPAEVPVERADYDAYRALLKGRSVLVDRNERRAAIQAGLEAVFESHGADVTAFDLLEEVTDLVEWPDVVEAQFDPRYLELPREVIQAAMMDHQRYFPVVRRDGTLEPRFCFVSNRPKEHAPTIRAGNERVLRARLEDASFFLREDLKRPLGDRVPLLSGVLQQEKLGTFLDKTRRLEALVPVVARSLGLGEGDERTAARAALLGKADLLTEMVKEFPQLQGVVGAHYAARAGEPAGVAAAIREQYQPRAEGDELPRTAPGLALSLADKLDNLVGFFAAGLAPTGSQDPYGLRRQAGAVVRLVLEKGLAVSLRELTETAARGLPAPLATGATGIALRVREFVRERAQQRFLKDGYRHDLIESALAAGPDDLLDLKRRLDALAELAKDQAVFPGLVELGERTFNISKALGDAQPAVDPARLEAPEEKALNEALEAAKGPVAEAIEARRYVDAGRKYALALAAPVHEFFEKVFVNVPDEALKRNRLALVRAVNRLFARVADLSRVTEGREKR